ncbi:MAG: acylphosphatase [Chromatiales bacterium]|nr:acylphosphatase [Gammaproteobacteria bacterium]MBW6476646.1 acylphosphatase [Chromatiales bacterium]
MACRRCLVSGRVQGVWFRDSARRQALALGVTGYARNLDDGQVELLACGESQALDAFQHWLERGPELARVDGLECMALKLAQLPADFTVR